MSIFSFLADQIEEQVSTVARQADVAEQVVNGIRQGLQPIMGGAWTGMGAQAFIDEVTSRLIPEIMELIAAITGFGGGITSAFDILGQADDVVGGIVSSLGDVFDGIF